jgi:hypothetical protein
VNVRAIITRAGIAVVTMFIMGFLLWQVFVREPGYYVTVESNNGAYLVKWSPCGWRRIGSPYAIRVAPADGDGGQMCRLSRSDAYRPSQALSGVWQYGSVPAGYDLRGDCPSLGTGRLYRIRAGGGPIGGEVVFRSDERNGIRIVRRSCSGWARWF